LILLQKTQARQTVGVVNLFLHRLLIHFGLIRCVN